MALATARGHVVWTRDIPAARVADLALLSERLEAAIHSSERITA
jgi:hypothetical protein